MGVDQNTKTLSIYLSIYIYLSMTPPPVSVYTIPTRHLLLLTFTPKSSTEVVSTIILVNILACVQPAVVRGPGAPGAETSGAQNTHAQRGTQPTEGENLWVCELWVFEWVYAQPSEGVVCLCVCDLLNCRFVGLLFCSYVRCFTLVQSFYSFINSNIAN